jgi:hypothetical protein
MQMSHHHHYFDVPSTGHRSIGGRVGGVTTTGLVQPLVANNFTLFDSTFHANFSTTEQQLLMRTIPETTQYIAQWMQDNITHYHYLKDQLLRHSKVYFPGPWDGAGIVLEEHKLIFFTQGKVRFAYQ